MFDIKLLDNLMSALACDGYFKVTFSHTNNELTLAHEVFEKKPYRISIRLENENDISNLATDFATHLASTSLDEQIQSYVDIYFNFTPIPSYTGLVRGVEEIDNMLFNVAIPRLKRFLVMMSNSVDNPSKK